MGIPGLLKEIGKGERVALAKLAIDHFEKHRRPLRIAIDAAIWNFQTQSGQGGKNPALRTLFFRLLRLLALPINPVFVYDGKNKPLTKRGKTVSRYGHCVSNDLSKNLVARFQFPHHTAPGEAEAECAFLQKNGIVDAVMSQDVDAIMFGSTLTLRDWSKEGTKGNKAPTHVSVLEQTRVMEVSGLDVAGMVLVALLSGGDYHEGVQGFGIGLSCQIAKAGFGEELITLLANNDERGLKDWRERLQYELETNESGYFLKRHRTVQIPNDFPDSTVLAYYLTPAVSKQEDLRKLEARWLQWWDREIDVSALREYTAMTFDWLYKGGARKYIRCLAQPLFQHQLSRNLVRIEDFSISNISERRKHFINDGIPELRLTVTPSTIVGIDLEAEEDNPEYAEFEEDEEAVGPDYNARQGNSDVVEEPASPSKQRKILPWDPSKPEKWWISETLLQEGMFSVVEAWNQEQLAIRADPVRFATRKCKPPTNAKAKAFKKIDPNMTNGSIEVMLPKTAPNCTNIPPRARKPLERAKTDTVLFQPSQEVEITEYFKTTKSMQPSFSGVASRVDMAVNLAKSVVGHGSDSDLHVDLFDLLKNNSKLGVAGLNRPANVSDMIDATASPSVTQRKKKAQKAENREIPDENDDDKDVVYIGSKRLLPPISSFFGRRRKSDPQHESRPCGLVDERAAGKRTAQPVREDDTACSLEQTDMSKPVKLVSVLIDGVIDSRPTSGNSGKVSEVRKGFPVAPTPAEREDVSVRAVGRMAVLRESLPGTWKEAPVTPSHNANVVFIDLTNT